MYSFKEILFKKMKEKGFTMQGLSLAAGLSKGAVKGIAQERSIHPRIDTVERLSKALGCSPLELLPPEWSETAGQARQREQFNERLFAESVSEALEISRKLGIKLTDDQIAKMAYAGYLKKIQSGGGAEMTELKRKE